MINFSSLTTENDINATPMFSLTKTSKSSRRPEELAKSENLTILYARLSQDDRDYGDSSSIQNQHTLLQVFSESNHFENTVFLSDDGISGLTFKRPAIQLALNLVKEGRVTRFVVKDLSRFGRDDIEVKIYTQLVFPEQDIQFIAINDSVDSTVKGSDTIISIKSLLNDWHSRDLSEKIKQAYQIKGNKGMPTYPNVHYGYRKAEDYKETKMWVVDKEAAAVVKRIFHEFLSGESQWAIARNLREDKILTPTCYFEKVGIKTPAPKSADPYYWNTSTVGSILKRYEYCGHLINFKTYNKSYKLKKRLDNSEHIKIFRNHHEAIIDEETFELARIKREKEHRPRPTKTTPIGLFNGLVYCAGCGEHHNFRGRDGYYYCSGFHSRLHDCTSSHGINEKKLTPLVLQDISRIAEIASRDVNELADILRRRLDAKNSQDLIKSKQQVREDEKRLAELDKISQKLFESNALGHISDTQFCRLNDNYMAEREQLAQQLEASQKVLKDAELISVNIERFLEIVKKRLNPTELTPIMLRQWISRIEIGEKVHIDRKVQQEVKIFYRFVGEI